MPDETRPPLIAESIPSVAGGFSAVASVNAPFIFVNGIPNYGFNDGVACLTLEALRYNSVGKDVVIDRVIVGHLRLSPEAFRHLKNAVNGIELLNTPPPENQVN